MLDWRTTSFSGVSPRSRTPQRSRGPTEASALTSCVISTLLADLPPHCPLFALQSLNLTHRWWSESEGTDVEERGMSTPLRQLLMLALYCTSARYQTWLHSSFQTIGRRPALSLTSALCRYSGQAPISQCATSAHGSTAGWCTPAGWVCLFETRFSLNVEHRGLAHCSRCSRVSLPGFSQAWPCVWPVTLSETAHSRPGVAASRIGCSAWFLSCLGLVQPLAVRDR